MSINQPASVPPAFPPSTDAKTSQGLAVASLILGIFSMIGGGLFIFPPILAVVFGHIAFSRAAKNKTLGGSGLALGGLITGYCSFIFITIGLLAAMAIPAFQKVRENSIRITMQNDARQIAAAAQQEMMEHPGVPVVFAIDPTTGSISEPLAKYVKTITKGTTAVDGRFENDHDGFSLQNPRFAGGKVFTFDSNGNLIGR